MKEIFNISLWEPTLEEYWYEQKLQSDPNTMDYNAGYDVGYEGYHYDNGCIDFPETKWEETYLRRHKDKTIFFAYIKDNKINQYVGYVNYHFNKQNNRYECGVVIEGCYRGKGYAKKALKLLCHHAFTNNIDALYNNFELDRISALKVFQDVGFKIIEKTSWKKFNKTVEGVIICLTKNDYQNREVY